MAVKLSAASCAYRSDDQDAGAEFVARLMTAAREQQIL
jgi:hypothetical protein